MSALPPKADIESFGRNVCSVPIAAFRLEICRKILITNPLNYHFGRFTRRDLRNIVRDRESRNALD
jgi:hypothetical protein